MEMPSDLAHYAIALGSNRMGRHGRPRDEVRAASRAIGGAVAMSPIIETAPVGPSIRRYANTVMIVESREKPPDLLTRLKAIERDFGRRRGQRWAARVIDLDIILWSKGAWASAGLIVPHPAFRSRGFVLTPLRQIAPDWRDPVSGLTIRQIDYRLRS